MVLWSDGTEELQGESVHNSNPPISFCETLLRVTAQAFSTNIEIVWCFYPGMFSSHLHWRTSPVQTHPLGKAVAARNPGTMAHGPHVSTRENLPVAVTGFVSTPYVLVACKRDKCGIE